ncbi:hypothetical protein [Paenibacillus cremeus]|nr:hypothetical protein [Paenibacillus cremeus]
MADFVMSSWWQGMGTMLFLAVMVAIGWCFYDARKEAEQQSAE